MKFRPPRRGAFVFLIFISSVVTLLIYRSRLLFGLLLENGSSDAVDTPAILHDFSSLDVSQQPQLIPKIIHQIWINDSIPAQWQEGTKAVKHHHEGWEYMLWTDQRAHVFMETTYPKYLSLYKSYPYAIQRADALRYFVLYHYGGIYLDLDVVPFRSLDPLIQFPAFACRTIPTGISNDVQGTRPGHPFFELVVTNLRSYKKPWVGKYITVMYTTGPLFLSVMWVEYMGRWKRMARYGQDAKEREIDRLRVLMREVNGENTYGFFTNLEGGSWHGNDMEVIAWMGRHVIIVTLAGFVIGFAVTGIVWFIMKTMVKHLERSLMGDRRA